jgi:metal-sulfur cluster biosynthetic enzyme
MDLDPQAKMILSEVIDPELGINIVELGLVYKVELLRKDEEISSVKVEMTLTTPGCPLGGFFIDKVTEVLATGLVIDPECINVKFVWDPPWTPEMMTLESKAELGLE